MIDRSKSHAIQYMHRQREQFQCACASAYDISAIAHTELMIILRVGCTTCFTTIKSTITTTTCTIGPLLQQCLRMYERRLFLAPRAQICVEP
eukprot:14108-Heterococcus_DN1.PRE.1